MVAYPEDDIKSIVDQVGSSQFLLMGSDYPHAEGVPEPADFAKEACEGGHVRLNGRSVGPDKPVRVGDMVEALTPGGRRVLRVLALAERRGSVALAQAIVDDLTPPPPPDPEPRVLREAGLGRPTKRDRRTIERLRGY